MDYKFSNSYFVNAMLKLKINAHLLECGTDEAGRGCLAGPVTAATIILQNPNIVLTKEQKKQEQILFQAINDSKQLSEKKRFELRPIIESLFDFSFTHIYNVEIDEINIHLMNELLSSIKTNHMDTLIVQTFMLL